MSKRHEHHFLFAGQEISAAATKEANYHAERHAWWKAEYEKAVVEAKEKGVEIREYDVTGGKHAQMVIDATVQSRLNEATTKIEKHRRAADELRIEAAAYGTQPARGYELDAEDVIHFRLAGGERQP